MTTPTPGTIGWHDLTVSDAEGVRDFYARVVGWKPDPVPMDGYSDFNMVNSTTGEPVAGVCHARGANADMPSQWLMYVVVKDLASALASVADAGGEVLTQPRTAGSGHFAIIRDPAGAVCGLYQSSSD